MDTRYGYVGVCPYYKCEKSLKGGETRLTCELAIFHLPDNIARREIVYGFCGHPDNFNNCPLKQTLDRYYERKYQQEH